MEGRANLEEVDDNVRRRAAFSMNHFRPGVDDSVRQLDPRLWHRVRMFIRSITDRYVNSDNPIGAFEVDIHDLWYLVIETAKITSSDDATADRLVNQVLYARELGIISRLLPRKIRSNNDQPEEEQGIRMESAITSTSARIWVDLPFLVTDLRAVWVHSLKRIPITERENLAGFTARLVAFGVCDDQLASCVLILFREVLETPRRIVDSDPSVGTDNADTVPLSEFLPAILAWLWYSSYKILSLCARNHGILEDNHEWTAVGELLATNKEQQQPGFNMPRWQFWKTRLQEISQNAYDESVTEQGRKCAHIMERWEQITGGTSHDREIARDVYFGNLS